MKRVRPADHRERQKKRRATPFDHRCPPGEECPNCGECNKATLIWNDTGEHVLCHTCKVPFIPGRLKPEAATDWKALATDLATALRQLRFVIDYDLDQALVRLQTQAALVAYEAAIDDKETP